MKFGVLKYLFVLTLLLVVSIVLVLPYLPVWNPQVINSKGFQHYTSLAVHFPGDQQFKLYPSTSTLANTFGSVENYTSTRELVMDKPARSGIYDVVWNAGLARAALVVNVDPIKPDSKILLIVPDYTWQAYNMTGGSNLYTQQHNSVSLLRPLGQYYSKDTIKHLIRHYVPFIRIRREPYVHEPSYNPSAFIENQFGKIDVVAQSVLDKGSSNYRLSHYTLLIIYGHDEYWTANLKETIENAVYSGTNLLNISGNTSWWKANVTNNYISREDYWHNVKKLGEEALLGVSFRFAGFPIERELSNKLDKKSLAQLSKSGFPKDIPSSEIVKFSNGFKVINSRDNVLSDISIENGDWIGLNSQLNYIETDGWPLTDKLDLAEIESNDYTSKPIPIAATWTAQKGEIKNSASMVRHQFGEGTVLSFGTVGWVRSILRDDKVIKKITKNAITELLSSH